MVHRKIDSFQFMASERKSICMWDWLNRSHYFIVTLFLCLCVYAFHRIIFYQIILQISKICILSWFCQFSGKFTVVLFVLSPGDGSQQFILPTFIVYISPLFLIDLKLRLPLSLGCFHRVQRSNFRGDLKLPVPRTGK